MYESGTTCRWEGARAACQPGVETTRAHRRARAAWALLALGLGAWAPARADPGPARLQVVVEPRTVDAEHPRARIRVTTPGPMPRLVPSAGEVQDLRRLGALTFAAEYVAPRDALPRLAVIAAFLNDGDCGMGTVRIAGPEAAADVPGPAPIAVVFQPQFVEGDQDAEVLAYLFAADAEGRPLRGPPPVLAVGLGEVSAAEPVGRGVWRARWHVPPRKTPGATLSASFPGGASTTATLTGTLASLEVLLDRKQVVPGDPQPVAVTVLAWDSAHEPTEAEVALTSPAGDLGELERLGRGVYRASLTMPVGLRGSGVVNVQARSGPVVGEAPLAFAPGEPASVAVGGPAAMPGDDSATRLLSVEVVDALGNPVDDVEPAVEAQHATVGAPARVGPGSWMVPYRPQRVSRDLDDLVVARAGPVSGQHAVQLGVPVNRFSLGPKLGVRLAPGGTGLAAGGEAGAWTHVGAQQVGLVLDASFWSLGYSGDLESLGGAHYRNQRSYSPLLLSAAWRRPLRGSLMLWASAGGGAAHVATVNRLSAQETVSEAAWAPAASGAVSLGLWTWNGFPFVELRGTWIGDPGLPTLRGSLTAVLLQLGYRFHAD